MNEFLKLLVYGIIDGCILAVPSVGFSLQFGVTNYVNFAYGAFITLGAFVGYELGVLFPGISFWPDLLISGAAIAVGSLIIGVFLYTPFSRKRPQLLFGLTLTFTTWLIIDNLITGVYGANYFQLPFVRNISHSFKLGPVPISGEQIRYFILAIAVLAIVYVLLWHTRLGREMRAISDDADLARVCGMSLVSVRAWTWIITGFVAGISGVVLADQTGTFQTGLGDEFIYLVVAATILGGIGRPQGAALGGLVIGLVSDFAVPVMGAALSPVLIFAVLVVLMALRPGGVFGAVGRSRFGNA